MSTTTPPAQTMKREDYKAIKHMDKAALTAYLSRVYMRGYEAGLKATTPETASLNAADSREDD